MSRVEIRAVTKVYGARTALRDVNLTVEDGEFCVVVGPSGCGKSTLLRIVAGLERATSGHVLMDGRVVDDDPPYSRSVGVVFQNYALYPHMTVYQNLTFGLQANRLPRDEISQRLERATDVLELGELLSLKPGVLSGGQRQRVALGRALVRDPKLFLLDEPLSNLDALVREKTRVELRRLHDRVGRPTIYVTHDQTEAMTMADRIAVLQEGTLIQVGSPDDIYNRPATVFVARFFGSPPMNIVPIVASRVHQQWTIQPSGTGAASIVVPAEASELLAQAVNEQGQAWLGFRGERFLDAPPSAGLQLPMEVDTVESLGARLHIHGNWAGQRLICVAAAGKEVSRRQVIPLQVPWTAVHWFHGSTEERITGPWEANGTQPSRTKALA